MNYDDPSTTSDEEQKEIDENADYLTPHSCLQKRDWQDRNSRNYPRRRVDRMYFLLQYCLEHGDFESSCEILPILLRCDLLLEFPSFMLPQIIQCSLLLSQLPLTTTPRPTKKKQKKADQGARSSDTATADNNLKIQGNQREATHPSSANLDHPRLLQTMWSECRTEDKEPLLLEIAAYRVRCNQISEAYDGLEGYLMMRPYSENVHFHGYCGMLACSLWKRESDARDDQNDSNGSHQGLSSSQAARAAKILANDQHIKRALKHFEAVYDRLRSDNERYLSYYIDLLTKLGRYRDALQVLTEFLGRNSTATANIMLYQLLKERFPAERSLRLRQAVKVRPCLLGQPSLIEEYLADCRECMLGARTAIEANQWLHLCIESTVYFLEADSTHQSFWRGLAELLVFVKYTMEIGTSSKANERLEEMQEVANVVESILSNTALADSAALSTMSKTWLGEIYDLISDTLKKQEAAQ